MKTTNFPQIVITDYKTCKISFELAFERLGTMLDDMHSPTKLVDHEEAVEELQSMMFKKLAGKNNSN